MESDEDEEDSHALAIPSEEMNMVIRDLMARLENLKTCYDLISKHGTALQRALTDVESGEDLSNRSKIVSERATLFRISSNAMINVRIVLRINFYKKFHQTNFCSIKYWCFRPAVIICRLLKIKGTNGRKCYSTNAINGSI